MIAPKRPALVAPLVRRRPRRHRDRRDVLPNPQRKFQEPYSGTYYTCTAGVGIFFGSATSFHPGGVNIAFADGSVHFIKDSINSWQIAPGTWVPRASRPPTAADGTCIWQMAPGTQLGVLPEARNPRRRRSHQLRRLLSSCVDLEKQE